MRRSRHVLADGQGLPERDYGYRQLSEEELAAILKEFPNVRCWLAMTGFGFP